jgi:hypothetical protein
MGNRLRYGYRKVAGLLRQAGWIINAHLATRGTEVVASLIPALRQISPSAVPCASSRYVVVMMRVSQAVWATGVAGLDKRYRLGQSAIYLLPLKMLEGVNA